MHLSLMTGQRSGRRGNKTGKFSTLYSFLWLREAVLLLHRKQSRSFLSFNVTVQYTVILATPQPGIVGDILLLL